MVSRSTVGHYHARLDSFWEGTKDHDVSQNIETLLKYLPGEGPQDILDFGCGPGRDLVSLSAMGHRVVGLDGAASFVHKARVLSGCEVLHQDFLSLDLPELFFHGIFANASLFHIPGQSLPRVLSELHAALRADGVLFWSNPRGPDTEGWNGERYGTYLCLETWRGLMDAAGFRELVHYYRPPGRPRSEQPWLASAWRRLP